MIYDYEKYGDSPACLGHEKDLAGEIALVQGFGITEDGTTPDGILEANVTVIDNTQCSEEMDNLKSKYGKEAAEALPDGPTDAVLCTKGIWNKKKSVFTVSLPTLIIIYITILTVTSVCPSVRPSFVRVGTF